jgi:predicted transglutaminase-like cysteine proteinase
MTDAQRAQLRQVNTEANAIPYVTLSAQTALIEGPDLWRDKPVPNGSWMCRDYVQYKATELRQKFAWAGTALTSVLLWTEPVKPTTGADDPAGVREYHCILAAEIDGECWILDNRWNDIYLAPPSKPPYDYIWDERQVPGSLDWRSVRNEWIEPWIVGG